MQYRNIGSTGVKASILGFGCMRFPILNNNDADIDREKTIPMLRRAHELGVNYYDTAFPYHAGTSESVVGEALKPFREDVIITTKMFPPNIASRDDMEKMLNTQLERLQTNYIDFYFLHAIDRKRWAQLMQLDVLDFLQKALADGRIRHAGFSFHDSYEIFTEILDSFDWELVQLQHNYAQINHQAGIKGLELAASRGIGVSIMEPMHGGDLSVNIPVQVPIWEASSVKRTPVAWALRYLWSLPSVSLLLSGMGEMSQLEENVALASDPAMCAPLSADEAKTLKDAGDAILSLANIPCTRCRYCCPCPADVNIPENFSLMNEYRVFNNLKRARNHFNNLRLSGHDASRCRKCGACLTKCPQKIQIPDELAKIAQAFAPKQ